MSKKVLNYAGRLPMLLALTVMTTFTFGLLFSGWLTPTHGKAQPNQSDPTNSVETTNCVVAYITTNCTEGSVNFASSSVSACGLPIIVSVILTNTAGQIVIDTTYTNTGNSGSNACPDAFVTSTNAPAIISENWVDTSASYGDGLSASFTPTTQSSAVTFTVVWQHVCDTGTSTATTSVGYNVPCPTITNCTVLPPPSEYTSSNGYYGATIGYNFNCATGWYSWEKVAIVSDSCSTDTDLDVATNASNFYNWNDGDNIYNTGEPGASCTTVTSQTIYFALVGGGGTTNDNSVCSFPNTQTITVHQTNSSSPPHGTIITSVTIGGGISTTNTY